MNCEICDIKQKLYEDDKVFAFLSPKPSAQNEISIATKQHHQIIEQVPDYIIGHAFEIANKLSIILFETLKVEGTNIIIDNGVAAGQEQPHLTIKIIPRKQGDGLNFNWQPTQLNEEEQSKIELTLKEACKNLGAFEKEKTAPLNLDEKEKTTEEQTKTKQKDEKENYLIKQLNKTP